MPIRLLLADDSYVIRSAIGKLLQEDSSIEVIGTATTFAEMLQLTAAMKPDVLLVDLHMQDEGQYPPAFVKSQTFLSTKCIVAISFSIDEDAKALAKSVGAHVLLDKMKLYSELIPAIKRFCPRVSIPRTAEPSVEKVKRAAASSMSRNDAA